MPFSISTVARSFGFTLSIFAAGPAAALSCVPPSVQDAYSYAQASSDNYVVAVGALSPSAMATRPDGTPYRAEGGHGGYTQPTQFDGQIFTSSGFNRAMTLNVTVEITCTSMWCGSFIPNDDGLFFFRQNANGSYTLELGACGGWYFHQPTRADLNEVQQCYNSGSC